LRPTRVCGHEAGLLACCVVRIETAFREAKTRHLRQILNGSVAARGGVVVGENTRLVTAVVVVAANSTHTDRSRCLTQQAALLFLLADYVFSPQQPRAGRSSRCAARLTSRTGTLP
ncbi:unnamed protein product, partial [Ectocarpus sp. 12 AP-2014]